MRFDDGYAIHAPVGTYRPNGFGLFDMHGNVWEWCGSFFAENRAAVRGCAFNNDALTARSSNRDNDTLEFRNNNLGLRAARALQ